jgi:uncharacterized Rmd1/YagE family protein
LVKEREAERIRKLPKSQMARVTAYCTANAYRMDELLRFLKSLEPTNRTQAKQIDECIYTSYVPPISVFEIPSPPRPRRESTPPLIGIETMGRDDEDVPIREEESLDDQVPANASSPLTLRDDLEGDNMPMTSRSDHRRKSSRELLIESPKASSQQEPGELFFFEYGVVVMWGLTESQELLVLSLLKPFEQDKLSRDSVETEEFHYQYRAFSQPRIYNDVITLRNPASQATPLDTIGEQYAADSDHMAGLATRQRHQDSMIKLTLSHAIAQSVKLTLFEGLIDSTIDSTKHIPYIMAKSGKVPMSRGNIIRKIGYLFVMRMNVNLISPILDTPELFWSEPSLEPIYAAARGYLEISQRVELLNQRVSVLSDLLEMLKEHLNSAHGETLEWIIIILIAIEILIGLVTIFFDFFSLYGPRPA